MPERRKTMPLSDAKRNSNSKYLAKFINVTFRVTPEEKRIIEEKIAFFIKLKSRYCRNGLCGRKHIEELFVAHSDLVFEVFIARGI